MSKIGKIFKSKFIKSVFLRAVSIFTVISVAVVLIVLASFSSEITEGTLSDRKKQLEIISDTITQRMSETTDIALSIAEDSTFSILSSGSSKEGADITGALQRYLIGNGFIQYLAFYRSSEPNKFYTSQGEYSYEVFWNTYLKFDEVSKEEHLDNITKKAGAGIISLRKGTSDSFFTYVLTLPKFTPGPMAYVIAYIPLSKIDPLLSSQFLNGNGSVAIFDSEKVNLYTLSTLPDDVALSVTDFSEGESEKTVKINGEKYILQKNEAGKPSWTFISAIRRSDVITGLAQRELLLVALLLSLLAVAVIAIFFMIIVQYKPIRKLADEISIGKDQASPSNDDISVLSTRLAELKGDSEQKQKFESAYLVAESANKAKSAFLSNMSHDIRTPMNAIIGMTEIAVKNLGDPEYVGECLQKVQVASQYLLDIINNVLDMSRIESGRFTLSEETVNLPKLVYGLKTLLHPSMEKRRQKFIVNVENVSNESFVGDNVRITQIFVNILSNSIKFTQNDGTITLGMKQTASQKGFGDYVFTFTDNGIGMSAEFVERVFDTFSRSNDAATGKIEGTGLGMAIVKNLVDLMGGTIECQSKKDEGTTFTVKLHMKLAESENDDRVAEHLKQFEGEKALVLCENCDEIGNQATILTEQNIVPVLYRSIEEAVNALKNSESVGSPFKFVLIDGAENEEFCSAALKALSFAAKSGVLFILTAKDISEVKLSKAREITSCTLAEIPLFKSTLAKALNGEYLLESERAKVTDALDLKGKKVLLVEDNAINREIACSIIRETTAEVFETENGEEAVEAFKNHPEDYFDVILMDLQMPIMNGYEATKTIRTMGRRDSKTVPIYAMTANTFDEDVRQVKEVGMNGHIGKPYSSAELYKVLGSALNRKS